MKDDYGRGHSSSGKWTREKRGYGKKKIFHSRDLTKEGKNFNHLPDLQARALKYENQRA